MRVVDQLSMTVHWCTCTYTCAGTMLVLAREIVLVFALVLVFVPVPELVYLQDCVCTRLFSNVRTCELVLVCTCRCASTCSRA